ncbi:nose resistant to fluoxetine protein 6-like [Phlebotomus argentipes]|uniref:nose resistant to fluoxetine protein 6-like n=1 Tax=Phlebotomus argentipes TaxID=94469 RepID=UPI0028936E48|nr:nose resistant to fluoxetine protein 6-like [Phlebotomus argentipes]
MHRIDLWSWILIAVGAWSSSTTAIDGNCSKCQEMYGIDSHSFNGHPRPPMEAEYLGRISMMHGVIGVSREVAVNSRCQSELAAIGDALRRREIWALKVLDGSASFTPGFTLGNSHWLGFRGACEAAQNALGVTFDERYSRSMDTHLFTSTAPFDVDYRVVYATHASPLQFEMKFLAEKILHIGLCVPTSCTDADIWNMTQLYLDEGIFQYQDIFHIDNVRVVQVKSLRVGNGFHQKTSVKLLCGLVVFTCLMTFLSWRGDKMDQKDNNNGHQDGNEQHLESNAAADNAANSMIQKSEIALYQRIVNCFSLDENVRELVSTKAPTNSISVINGIRSIVCFWILCFHMYWFQHFTVSNTATLFATGERPYFLFISNAPLLVDVFFTISGFLHSYNFLRDTRKLEEVKRNNLYRNAKLFGRMLLNRYLRLSPLFFVVCLFGEVITAYLMDVSQFWIHERYDLTCQRYWWRNVLYIHNFFDKDELCMNWGWSIACEMQFSVIFTILLFIYAKNPQLCKKIFLGFTTGVFIVSLISHWRNRFQCSFDVIYNTGNELYMAPWNRIHPYIAGIFAGWYLISRSGKVNISPRRVKLLKAVSVFFFLLSIHSTVVRTVPYQHAAILLTVGRFAFGFSVVWLILCSICGFGGWFTDMLSAKLFVHINKLSYGVYLLNPLIISTIHGLRDGSSHFSPVISWVMTVGMMIIVYCVSFVFTLFFEIPYHKLATLMLRSSTKSKSA